LFITAKNGAYKALMAYPILPEELNIVAIVIVAMAVLYI